MHDTFAKERAQLSGLPYLARTVSQGRGVSTHRCNAHRMERKIDLLKIDGIRTNEHVCSSPLADVVVADVFFSGETRGCMFFCPANQCVCRGCWDSGFFVFVIRDKRAFERSMKALLEGISSESWWRIGSRLRECEAAVERALRDAGVLGVRR